MRCIARASRCFTVSQPRGGVGRGVRVSPAHRQSRSRRWRRLALASLLLLLAADYALYPSLSRPGGRSANTGENGLWLRYRWYFGWRSEADVEEMARRLTGQQIRYAYFHVRHITQEGRLRYRYPEAARRLVGVVHHEAP